MRRNTWTGLIGLTLGAVVPTSTLVAQSPYVAARIGISADANTVTRQDVRPSRKESGTATLLSVLVAGGGQIYAGDVSRGLVMLGGAMGSIIAGAALSSYSTRCDYEIGACDAGNRTPLSIGVVAALGIWVYSIIDASPTVKRMNQRNGYQGSAVTPVVQVAAARRAELGIRVAF